MNQWLSDALFVMQPKEATQAVAPRPTAGPVITLDPDDAVAMLEKIEGAASRLAGLLRRAEALTMLTPPAPDNTSTAYNESITSGHRDEGAFSKALSHLREELDYLRGLSEKIKTALAAIARSDERAQDAVEKTTGDSGGTFG